MKNKPQKLNKTITFHISEKQLKQLKSRARITKNKNFSQMIRDLIQKGLRS